MTTSQTTASEFDNCGLSIPANTSERCLQIPKGFKKNTITMLMGLAVGILQAQIQFEEVTSSPFDGVSFGSVAFSDAGPDGNSYLLVTGENVSGQRSTNLYINDGTGGFSEVTGSPFTGVERSAVAFADVNNDGYPDALVTGLSEIGPIAKLYINYGSGYFLEQTGSNFTEVQLGSIAFADVNGDSYADVLITGINNFGQRIAKLYTNDGDGTFSEVFGTPFEGVMHSSVDFADVDGDGDQDLLITGANSQLQPIAKLYLNDGFGSFTENFGTPFDGVLFSSIAFSDVDGDGDSDVLITGLDFSDIAIAKLYTNDGMGNFTEVSGTPFEGIWLGAIAFADVDGDLDEDVLITGSNGSIAIAKVYSNDGSGNFTEEFGLPLDGVFYSSVAFSDIDYDGDPDVFITGLDSNMQPTAKLYNNISTQIPIPGCTTADNGEYTQQSTIPCDGLLYEVVFGLALTSQYSLVELTAGSTYNFSSSDPNHFITIANDLDFIYAAGTGTVSWSPTADGTYRFYTHLNSNCDYDFSLSYHSRLMSCPGPVIPAFAGDDAYRGTIASEDILYFSTMLANDAPNVSIVEVVGMTSIGNNQFSRFIYDTQLGQFVADVQFIPDGEFIRLQHFYMNVPFSYSFEYVVADAQGGLDTASVTITVDNSFPVAVDQSFNVPLNGSINIQWEDVVFAPGNFDPDGDPFILLGYTFLDPALGNFQGFGPSDPNNPNDFGSFTYTPTPGFSGLASFGYSLQDIPNLNGPERSPWGVPNVTITFVVGDTISSNQPPVAVDDFYSTNQGQTLTVPAPGLLANDFDPEGATLTLVGFDDATISGEAVVNPDGSFTYLPDASFTGVESFTYTITDGQNEASATVTITVIGLDCAGVPNGTSTTDLCGVCRLPNDPDTNTTCADCIGVPNGGAVAGSPCLINGQEGTYDASCICVENPSSDPCRYFLSNYNSNGGSDIYEFTLNETALTANLSLIYTSPHKVSIAYDALSGMLYMILETGNGWQTINVLTNPATINAESIMPNSIGTVTGAAFDDNGLIFIATEQPKSIKSVGFSPLVISNFSQALVTGGDIVFNPQGELLLISRSPQKVYQINQNNPNILLGQAPPNASGLARTGADTYLVAVEGSNELILGASDATDLGIRYDLLLNGQPFVTSDGDMASGCAVAQRPGSSAPQEFETIGSLSNLYSLPNPTNGISTVVYQPHQSERARLEVFDLQGRSISTIFDRQVEEHLVYTHQFDGSALPNGIYLYRLTTDNGVLVEKFMIAR